jgi:hypothetical protein
MNIARAGYNAAASNCDTVTGRVVESVTAELGRLCFLSIVALAGAE